MKKSDKIILIIYIMIEVVAYREKVRQQSIDLKDERTVRFPNRAGHAVPNPARNT